MTYMDRPIQPGDVVALWHGEMETKGLVTAVTHHGIHVEVNGPRPRMIVMPASQVEAL